MRARRTALGGAALVALAFVVIAVASAQDSDAPKRSDHQTDHAIERAQQERSRPAPGTVRLEGRETDPGGRAPWTLRVYQNDEGHICTDAAQVDDGVFGEDRGPSFVSRPKPEDFPVGCDALQTEPFGVSIMRRSSALTRDGGRTVVFGEVDLERINGVLIEGPGGERKPELSKRGTFITVYKGDLDENPKVTVEFADGTRRVVNP